MGFQLRSLKLTAKAPQRLAIPKGNECSIVFQPSIFSCELAVSFKEATFPSTGEFFRSPQWLRAILDHHLHRPRFPHETFQEIPAGPTSPEDPEDQLKSLATVCFQTKKGWRENPCHIHVFFLGGGHIFYLDENPLKIKHSSRYIKTY